MTTNRGRGRPRKQRYERAQNSADASLERIQGYTSAILGIMETDIKHSHAFSCLTGFDRNFLAHELSNEVAFYPAMQGLIDSTVRLTTGPKPKTAQALFLLQVKTLLLRYGISLPQWVNARGGRNDLADFCLLLLGLSGSNYGTISARTANKISFAEGWCNTNLQTAEGRPPYALSAICFLIRVTRAEL